MIRFMFFNEYLIKNKYYTKTVCLSDFNRDRTVFNVPNYIFSNEKCTRRVILTKPE